MMNNNGKKLRFLKFYFKLDFFSIIFRGLPVRQIWVENSLQIYEVLRSKKNKYK